VVLVVGVGAAVDAACNRHCVSRRLFGTKGGEVNITHLGQSAEGPDDPPRRRLVDPDAEHDAMVTEQMEDERMPKRTPQADSGVRQNLVDAAILEGCREEVAELLADEAMGSMRVVEAQRRFLDDLHALSGGVR